ncbi:osmotically inducible protein C [Microbispora rosea subsp. aerata]|nr:OsmC family protein [Microbispora rosea]GGO28410.1 osmotically inducible protein C [Microbispora rosea subsp. aerata]GIH58711.1 osmotically inducible protein C [Microbispora rosea subsp. aerata]GLJ82424.1 osmotically inducible protein C [Microbispora rosea subsp. aerata]
MGSVRVERTEDGFVARNERGAEIAMGSGDGVFSPVELLLAAVGGCNIMTVEPLTAQRGHRLLRLAVEVSAEKESPTLLRSITVTYDVELPGEDSGEVFAAVAERVHERHCTVSRSLRNGTEVKLDLGR